MRVLVLLAVLLMVVGCVPGETRTPTEEAARQKCLLKAEGNMALRGEKECIQRGLGWNECPHRKRIMADLAKEQEKCR